MMCSLMCNLLVMQLESIALLYGAVLEITAGVPFIKVWFMGNNIWRSAWNDAVISYPVDELSELRWGRALGSKVEMAIKRYQAGLWFEAKGGTGSETVSVTAVRENGKKEKLNVICGEKFEALEQEYTECTSSTTLGEQH